MEFKTTCNFERLLEDRLNARCQLALPNKRGLPPEVFDGVTAQPTCWCRHGGRETSPCELLNYRKK